MKIQKVKIILNRKSGSYFKFKKIEEEMLCYFHEHSYDYENIYIDDDLRAKLPVGDDEGCLYMCCGGDGTVSYVCNLISQMKLKGILVVYPLGTGNDFAKAFGVMSRSSRAKDYLNFLFSDSKIHNVDLWSFSGRVFVNYLSIGLDAEVVGVFDRLRGKLPNFLNRKWLNFVWYGCSVFKCLVMLKKKEFKSLQFGGEPKNLKVISLILCNITSYAGGLIKFKGNRADDGELGLKYFASIFPFIGFLFMRKENDFLKSSDISFEMSEPFMYQLDGEILMGAAGSYLIEKVGSVRVLGC